MNKIILATDSSKHLMLDNGKLEIGRFPDGEVSVVLGEDVKNKDVVIIGSTHPPAENLIELLLTLDAVVHHEVRKIKFVIPYLGYAKSDIEKVPGQSISSRAVINMIEALGGKKLEAIAVINIHSDRAEKFFKTQFAHISLIEELAENFKYLKNFVIVSPDEGGIERAKEFASFLDKKDIVTIKKNRLSHTNVKVLEISGNVDGTNAVIVDDMVQSGGTILSAARTLKKNGAKDIYVASIHMDYAAGGWKKLDRSVLIKRVVTTDSIKPLKGLSKKFKIVSIAPILKQAIFSMEH